MELWQLRQRQSLPLEAKIVMSQIRIRQWYEAWDLMSFEKPVLEGIRILSQHIKTWRHMCFMLVGFNTAFEEDMYRFRRLMELGVRP